MMNHKYWLKNLSIYFDNELPEPKRRKIEVHLQDCTICRDKLAAWQKIRNVQSVTPTLIPAPEVWQSISRRFRTEQPRPLHVWEDERVVRWLPNPVPAIVTGLIMLFIVVIAQPILTSAEKSDITIERYLIGDTELTSTNGIDILIPSTDDSKIAEGLI